MNKAEYMRELERLLQNIPENERVEALTYYEEYFDDAGVENEQQVIDQLGYPAKVAENIKEGLRGSMGYQNTGTGYQNTGYQHIGTQNVYTGVTPPPVQKDKEDMPTWAIVLIVIACIFASPILIGLAGTLLGAILSAFALLFGLLVGFGAGGVALIVSGIICVMLGIPTMTVSVFAGLFLCGVGCLIFALGLVMILGAVWLCAWAIPTFVKWLVRMFQKLTHKEQQVAA